MLPRPAPDRPPETVPPRRRLRRAAAIVAAVLTVAVVAIAGASAYLWFAAPVNTVGAVAFSRSLAIPPLADSRVTDDGVREFDLDLTRGTADLGHGPGTEVWGVDGGYLGPTVRAHRDEQVRVNVTNGLGETSTLHWHGMRVPAAMDGGPHQMIADGETWSPQWRIDQPAATLWYHPHLHGATAEHVYRGVAGLFLVDDEAPGDGLPDRYGIDDVPVIVQDKNFDGDRLDTGISALSGVGILGEEILVNGTPGPYLDVTTQALRLRLLNASTARVYDFGLYDEDGGARPYEVVATDGGLLEAPVPRERLMLSPGERAEIVVRVDPDDRLVLRSTPPDLGTDIFHTRFAGGADSFDVLELRAAGELAPSPPLPPRLRAADPAPDDPAEIRRFALANNRINGEAMDMSRIDAVVRAGSTEVWEVTNEDGLPHNFHVHDVQFEVLGTDDAVLRGRKDTVWIPAGDTRRLLVRFGDHVDPETPYMFHCHILYHEDAGMMGQFVVVGADDDEPTVIDHEMHDMHGDHGMHGGH
ncbi:copper oxidase [Rhodococcus rhodnii]|nr:multicopper oxidase domain-containing protein [Rhodococcus rhodnii]TXG92509.1 copper oxidase [Rhodococcus rhodnii]